MVAPDPRPLTQGLLAAGQLQLTPGHLDRLGVHSPHLLLKLTPERKLARDPLCHWAGPSRASGCAQATTQHYVPHPELASWGSLEDHRPSKPQCPQNRCHVTAGAQEWLQHYGLNCCGQPWAGVPREGTPLLAHSQSPQKREGIFLYSPMGTPPETHTFYPKQSNISQQHLGDRGGQKKAKKGQRPTVWGSGPLLKAPLQKDGLGKKNQSCT